VRWGKGLPPLSPDVALKVATAFIAAVLVGSFFCCALFAVPAGANPIVDVTTGSQRFGQMDLATGTLSPIGPVPATIQYLVPGPGNSLLTMSFNGDLVSIDRATDGVKQFV
jgi:hypothetical protein